MSNEEGHPVPLLQDDRRTTDIERKIQTLILFLLVFIV